MNKKNAIYTIVVGEEARKYAAYCIPSQTKYAGKKLFKFNHLVRAEKI